MKDERLTVDVREMRYSARLLIENLKLSIRQGEIVALVAPTGAGKTTLLRIIAGLEHRYSGQVLLSGRPVGGPDRDIQVVFQDRRLLPWMRVGANVAFAIGTKMTKAESTNVVRSCLGRVGLKGLEGQWPKTLSGGEEARAAFARILVNPPRVLLLDEPFSNVDVVVRRLLHTELLKLHAEFNPTIILVSHSIEDAVLLADRVLVLDSEPMRHAETFELNATRPRDIDDLTTQDTSSNLRAKLNELHRKRGPDEQG